MVLVVKSSEIVGEETGGHAGAAMLRVDADEGVGLVEELLLERDDDQLHVGLCALHNVADYLDWPK